MMDRYYDLVLVLIPLALVGVGGLLLLAGVRRPVAVSVAGTAAIGLIGHAIFVNGPVRATSAVADETTTTESNATSGPSVTAD